MRNVIRTLLMSGRKPSPASLPAIATLTVLARVPRLISSSRLVGAVIVPLGVVVTAFSNPERSRSMTRP
jgi:hypothetical protein